MNGQHNKKEGILFRHLFLYICGMKSTTRRVSVFFNKQIKRIG